MKFPTLGTIKKKIKKEKKKTDKWRKDDWDHDSQTVSKPENNEELPSKFLGKVISIYKAIH